MTLSGHIAVAGAIYKTCPNPTVAIVLNILVHPVLDAIPHAEWSTFRNQPGKMLAITATDAALTLWLIWQLYVQLSLPPGLLVGLILASLWLDALDFPAQWLWPKLHWFHEYMHSWPELPYPPVHWGRTATGQTPTWIKLCGQAAILLLAYLRLAGYA